jgi:hypothetical protein
LKKKNKKISNFFKSAFETQKQTGINKGGKLQSIDEIFFY